MNLSHSEKRIIEELIKGTEIKQIPTAVLMTMRQVERHIHALKQRFNCRTNFQLGHFIAQNDLLIKLAENRTDQRA
jgi:DNA-binding NarL/FixJ family response regulator